MPYEPQISSGHQVTTALAGEMEQDTYVYVYDKEILWKSSALMHALTLLWGGPARLPEDSRCRRCCAAPAVVSSFVCTCRP